VLRTVREYEAAGVAAVQIEDQVTPKRCGHMAGRAVIPAGEMVEKVRAAVEARRSPDLVIIARTLFNGVEGGLTPSLEVDRLRALGFRIVLLPLTALFAATRAVQEALAAIRAHPAPGGEGALPFSASTDVVGLPSVQALEQRYAAR
jgi:2-methylisocitrate lyase-like PEP mutase family enzyme